MNRGWRSGFLSRLRLAAAASRIRESNGNVGEEDRFADTMARVQRGWDRRGKRRVSSKSDRYRRYRCSSYLAAGQHSNLQTPRKRKKERERKKRREGEREKESSLARYRGITVITRTHDFHISPASQWCIQCLIYVVSRPRDRWIFSTAIKRKLHADYEIVIRRSIPPRREN